VPNEEYLDKSVRWKIRSGQIAFAEPTHAEVADAIADSGLALEVGQRLGSGKEADVYLCRDERRLVAVKVYRQYRTSHRGGGAIKLESMGRRALEEFDLLNYAWEGGARVPEPGRRIENMFSMQYLGAAEGAAPTLQHVALEDPARFRDLTLAGIEDLAGAGIVHTDLSPFNILVHDGEPWFIDFASALRIDRLGTSPWIRLEKALAAMRHGLGALDRYFHRYGLSIDVEDAIRTSRVQFDRFGVL